MTTTKQWKTGVADEAWKIAICARDAQRAQDIASHLAYLMTDIGGATFEQQLEAIRGFSGEQITAALFNRCEQAVHAIERGLVR